MRLGGEDCCDICFQPDVEEEDIIYCDICGQCYHPSCAGLPESVVEQETHVCGYCVAGTPPCLLCNCRHAMHAFPLFDGFVHTVCYRLSPYPYNFEAPGESLGRDVSKQ